MARPISTWALPQLERLASRDPHRADQLLDCLWENHPRLLGEMAIAAADRDELSIEECARVLNISEAEVTERLHAFRRQADGGASLILVDAGVARLAESRVTVWEIVRERRRLGSLEKLMEAYPGIAKREMEAAFAYAADHPQEIDALIERYEDLHGRRRTEYPFAR